MALFAKLVRISLNLTLARTLNRVNNSERKVLTVGASLQVERVQP
jgi:hypothetical protein